MQTLTTGVQKLVTEHGQDVRDALRKLRDPRETEVTITGKDGKPIVIERLNPTKPAK